MTILPAVDYVDLACSFAVKGQPTPAFKTFDRIAQRTVGRIFFTALMVNPDGSGERVYSSNLDAYPMPHRKPFPGNGWVERVLEAQQPSLSRNMKEYLQFHTEREVFERLGCGCLLNLPVIHDGIVVGCFNLGDETERYNNDTIEALTPLVNLFGPSLALMRQAA